MEMSYAPFVAAACVAGAIVYRYGPPKDAYAQAGLAAARTVRRSWRFLTAPSPPEHSRLADYTITKAIFYGEGVRPLIATEPVTDAMESDQPPQTFRELVEAVAVIHAEAREAHGLECASLSGESPDFAQYDEVEIRYVVGGMKYRILFADRVAFPPYEEEDTSMRRTLSRAEVLSEGSDEMDVTGAVAKYAGPRRNFYADVEGVSMKAGFVAPMNDEDTLVLTDSFMSGRLFRFEDTIKWPTAFSLSG